jgi:hypothetical protein
MSDSASVGETNTIASASAVVRGSPTTTTESRR